MLSPGCGGRTWRQEEAKGEPPHSADPARAPRPPLPRGACGYRHAPGPPHRRTAHPRQTPQHRRAPAAAAEPPPRTDAIRKHLARSGRRRAAGGSAHARGAAASGGRSRGTWRGFP